MGLTLRVVEVVSWSSCLLTNLMGFNKVGNTTSVQVVTIKKKKQDLFAKGGACVSDLVVLSCPSKVYN